MMTCVVMNMLTCAAMNMKRYHTVLYWFDMLVRLMRERNTTFHYQVTIWVGISLRVLSCSSDRENRVITGNITLWPLQYLSHSPLQVARWILWVNCEWSVYSHTHLTIWHLASKEWEVRRWDNTVNCFTFAIIIQTIAVVVCLILQKLDSLEK